MVDHALYIQSVIEMKKTAHHHHPYLSDLEKIDTDDDQRVIILNLMDPMGLSVRKSMFWTII